MSQCGKSIPEQIRNPACGYEIAVSLHTSEDVKSTTRCQGWLTRASDMGLQKMSHPGSSQERGKIKGQWGTWDSQFAQLLQTRLKHLGNAVWITERRKTCARRRNSETCSANCGPAKREGNGLQNSDPDLQATWFRKVMYRNGRHGAHRLCPKQNSKLRKGCIRSIFSVYSSVYFVPANRKNHQFDRIFTSVLVCFNYCMFLRGEQ